MSHQNIDKQALSALENELQQKVKEYEEAEIQSKAHNELNILYQKIKDLQFQIALLHPVVRKAVN